MADRYLHGSTQVDSLTDGTNQTTVAKINTNLAPVYSTSSTYAVGDFVTYLGTLYKCNTAITTAEAWTAAHWTATNVVSEMSGGTQLYRHRLTHQQAEGRPLDYIDFYTTNGNSLGFDYFASPSVAFNEGFICYGIALGDGLIL